MSQNWKNTDGLFLQFGTDKAIAETGGEFKSYGTNRVIEVYIDATTLTSTAAIQSNTTFFPAGTANVYIEKVDVTAEVALASGTSFSVGLIQDDRSTIPSNYSTSLINAEVTATLDTAGKSQTYYQNTTHAGGLIGSAPVNTTTSQFYITALSSGTFTTGKLRVRIYYHGIGTISQ